MRLKNLEAAGDDVLECRSMGHAWSHLDDAEFERRRGEIVRFVRTEQCTRCDTQRWREVDLKAGLITPYTTHIVGSTDTTATYRVDLRSPQLFVLGDDAAYTDQIFIEMTVERHPRNDARLNQVVAARAGLAKDGAFTEIAGWEPRAVHASRNAHDFAVAAAIGA